MSRTLMIAFLALLGLSACAVGPEVELAETTRAVPADDVALVVVDQGLGGLEVRGDPAGTEVRLVVTLSGPDVGQERLEELTGAVTVELDVVGDEVHVVTGSDIRSPRYGIHTVVTLPAGLDVEIDDGTGELFVSDVGAVSITDGSGELELRDALGPVHIDDESGGLRVVGVGEALTVNDTTGELYVEGVSGPVEIVDTSGGLQVRDVDGDVAIDDTTGEILVRDVTGTVSIVDTSGGIVVQDAGEVDIVSDTTGDVVITRGGVDLDR